MPFNGKAAHKFLETMAKQQGYVKIKGSLGGLTFYKKNGDEIIRTTGGVSKERILSDPSYRRTRENMKEFAGAATAGKGLREGFKEIAKRMSDDYAVGRITGMMKRINSVGVGQRGQRPIHILLNKLFIEGFDFNKVTPLGSVLHASYSVPSLDVNRSIATWTVPDFDTDTGVTAPEGATHFKLVLASAVLSDYVYSSATKTYEPTSPEENSVRGVTMSAELPIGGMVGSDTTLTVDLGFTAPLPPTVGVLVGVGIIFYQLIQTEYYELASNNSLRIVMVG